MTKTRNTVKVRRGLEWIMQMAWADFESAMADEDGGKSHGLDRKGKADVEAAFQWLKEQCRERKSASAEGG